MDHVRQIVKMFHDEHVATLATLERFAALLHAHREGLPADAATDGEITRMMRDIEVLIAGDLVAHFAFEEASLFPLLTAAGDGAMGALLAEEHDSIRVTAARLATSCHAVRAGASGEADWRDFSRLGFDFVDQLTDHIRKEEMGLLTELDGAVDEDRDAALVMAYSAVR